MSRNVTARRHLRRALLLLFLAALLTLSVSAAETPPVAEVPATCENDGHLWQRQGYLLPTCEEDGYSGDVLCLRCGAVKETGISLPATCACDHFTDLLSEAWYHESVDFSVNAGLMNGISVCAFAPEGPLSRAMIVSVLYRMEEQPAISGASTFTDVLPEQWYADAVLWATETGLVNGYGDGRFGPEDNVTRQQLVTLFYRYAQYKDLPLTDGAALDSFTDAALIAPYAQDACAWGVASGLIQGHEDSRLEPEGFALRCQFSAILRRWYLGSEWTQLPYIDCSTRNITVYLEGQKLACAMVRGLTLVRATDFATATGLTLESTDPLLLTGADTVRLVDGLLTVNSGESIVCPAPVILDGETWLPIFHLTQALAYPTWHDPLSDIPYITPSARTFSLPEDVNVPVLMYHAVSDDCWGTDELFVRPENMEAQLRYLVENGYDPIWFSDLSHLEDYDKPVILTFDDGYDDNYAELLPLLKKYNVKATVFVIAESVGWNHKMDAAQIREMADSGLVSIQSHGWSHGDMDKMDRETLHFELRESQQTLTRLTGRIPSVLCYPTGRYSNLTLEVAQSYYNFGLKMTGGLYNTSDDPYLVSRYYIARYTSLSTFASYLRRAGT